MKSTSIALTLSLLLTTACMPIAEARTPSKDECGASDFAYLIGRRGSILNGMKFAGPVRILEFGQPMTMDYNPARLNIEKNKAGAIGRVWCG